MQTTHVTDPHHLAPDRHQPATDISRDTPAKVYAALLSGITTVCLASSVTFHESLATADLTVALVCLLVVYCLSYRRILFCREFALYAALFTYLSVSLSWTPDTLLGLNTLWPAVNFLLILLLLGSFFAYLDIRAVLTGTLIGFLASAAAYSYLRGFPFVYPDEFSYNAVAAMYLFGLLITLAFGWAMGWRLLPIILAVIILVHIVATTSIKTNLGIALGAGCAAIVHSRGAFHVLRRYVFGVAIALLAIVYFVASNEMIVYQLEDGFDRISLGLKVLQARENVVGYSGFELRARWVGLGLQGWSENPLFGHGVEAFRSDYRITSHSAPIDLLYNTGLIGFLLFYAIFASLMWRLLVVRGGGARGLRALILATLICYLFISISATAFYDAFLACFIAFSVALLRRLRRESFVYR